MIRNGLAARPTEAQATIEAALYVLLDHVSCLLAKEYVALVREDSRCQANVRKEEER